MENKTEETKETKYSVEWTEENGTIKKAVFKTEEAAKLFFQNLETNESVEVLKKEEENGK